MARIKFYKNMFEDSFDEIEVTEQKTLEEYINDYSSENPYASDLVECYDVETGKTYFAPLSEDETSVLIRVGEEIVSPDYIPKGDELVTVIFTPLGGSSDVGEQVWGGILGFLGGAIIGAITGAINGGGVPGAIVGAVLGGVTGAIAGVEGVKMKQEIEAASSGGAIPERTTEQGKEVKRKPDVRGASNQSLINNPYPYVIGKHLVTPYLVGKPVVEYIVRDGGENNYSIAFTVSIFAGGYFDQHAFIEIVEWRWIKTPTKKFNSVADFVITGDNGKTASCGISVSSSKSGGSYKPNPQSAHFDNDMISTLTVTMDGKSSTVSARVPDSEAIGLQYYSVNTSLSKETTSINTEAYISLLLCAGYGPLKLTDFKLGDYMLAYNRPTDNVKDRKTLLRGTLQGNSGSSGIADSGDILDIWKNNDVKLEIIQNKKGEEYSRGTIYPLTVISKELNANVLYVADKTIEELAEVTYKGTSFPNNFKTNNVYFTESYPMFFSLVMYAQNGLFATRSHSTSNSTRIEYSKIPIYYCIQWRPYNEDNSSSDSTGADYDSWNNITTFSGTDLSVVYTEDIRRQDIAAHAGNSFSADAIANLNKNFIGKTVVDFGKFSGENFVKEMHFTADVDLQTYANEHPDRFSFDDIIGKKNKPKAIEVRILRVSPSYLNQETSSGDYGPFSYSDLVSVQTITTRLFDDEVYKTENKKLLPVYAIPKESDLENFCYIAIRAKADSNGYIQNVMDKVSCIAESFSPHWDSENKKWLPEGVTRKVNYFGFYKKEGVDESKLHLKTYRDTIKDKRTNRDATVYEVNVTEKEFVEARKDRLNWTPSKAGSNYSEIMKKLLFKSSFDSNTCYLTEGNKIYNDNSSASGFLLSCVGPQNGITALGYEDIDLSSLGYWYEDTQELQDGSVDEDGVPVKIRMEANAYLFKTMKLESVLSKLATTGRACYTYNENGKIKVIMDKVSPYPVGVISDQSCYSSQDTYLYEEQPAGFVINFKDENDGYETNSLYCWADGNSYNSYKGQVVPYGIDFVTNPRQMWSLGRYLLACKLLNTQVLTRKLGPEGLIYSLGDVLLVQSDSLLVGDTSGRVQQIIENSGIIYGLVTDSTYEYTGQLDADGKCTQGVSVLQPKQFGKSRVVTLRLGTPGQYVDIGEEHYELKKGVTNIVLFDKPVNRYMPEDKTIVPEVRFDFGTGDICLYGEYKKTAAPYRIIRIKQENDNTFTETLVRYTDGIYNYGAKIPSFQSYAKTPPVPRDPISLSDVPSNLLDLNKENQGNTDLIYNDMSKLYSNRTINLYRRSTTILTEDDLPKSDVVYDFSTDSLDPMVIDGWYFDYRTSQQGEGSMYFTSATVIGKKIKSTITPDKWNPPIVFGANGADGTMGLNGLTIFIEKSALTFDSLDAEGNVREGTIVDRVHMEIDGDPVSFTIGDIDAANPDVKGFKFSKSVEDVIIEVLPGSEMAKNGFITIPLNSKNVIQRDFLSDEDGNKYVDETGKTYGVFRQGDEDVNYRLYVSYAKAERGIQGEKGNDGENGPYYMGYFPDHPIGDKAHPLVPGCWYLNSIEGKIYEYTKNEVNPWVEIPMEYSDPRVKICINDMMEIANQGTVVNDKMIATINLWCKNLVANKAFIKYLSTQNIVLQEGEDNTAGTLSSSNYDDTPGQYKGFKIDTNGKAYLNDAIIRGEVNASSGNIEGDVTSKNFYYPKESMPVADSVKTTAGYRLNSNSGLLEANKAILNKGLEVPYMITGETGYTDLTFISVMNESIVPAESAAQQFDAIIDYQPSGFLNFERKIILNGGNDIFVPCIVTSLTDAPIAPGAGRLERTVNIGGGIGRRVTHDGHIEYYIGTDVRMGGNRVVIRDNQYYDDPSYSSDFSKIFLVDYTQYIALTLNSLMTYTLGFHAVGGIQYISLKDDYSTYGPFDTEAEWLSLVKQGALVYGKQFMIFVTEAEPIIEAYLLEVVYSIEDDVTTATFYIPSTKSKIELKSNSDTIFKINGSKVVDICQ